MGRYDEIPGAGRYDEISEADGAKSESDMPDWLRNIQTAQVAYLAAHNNPLLAALDLSQFDEAAFSPELRQLYQTVHEPMQTVPAIAYALGGPEHVAPFMESGREFESYEIQRAESYNALMDLEKLKFDIDQEIASLDSQYDFPVPSYNRIVTGGSMGLWTMIPSGDVPVYEQSRNVRADSRIEALAQIPPDIKERYYQLQQQSAYITAKGYHRGTLEAVGRVFDTLGPMQVRHIFDEAVNAFQEGRTGSISEWHKLNMGHVATTFLGATPDGKQTLSYIDTLNDYYYGSHEPALHDPEFSERQLPWQRWAIISAGLGLDIALDPIWLVGAGIGQLGTKAKELEKIRGVMDDLARVWGRHPLTPDELAEMLTKEKYAAMFEGDVSPWMFKDGKLVAKPVGDVDAAKLAAFEKELAERGVARPEVGSPQWDMLVAAYEKYGTLVLPTSRAEQFARGMRGLITIPMLRSTRTPSIWTRSYELGVSTTGIHQAGERIGKVFQYGWHMEPVGGSTLAPAARYLERLGITDGWTFMDTFLHSGLHAGEADTRQARRNILRMRQRFQAEYKGAKYALTVKGLKEDKELHRHLQDMWGHMSVAERETYGVFDDFIDEVIHGINQASEKNKYLRSYSVTTEAGEASVHTMLTDDPLYNPGRPEFFNDPWLQDYVKSIRERAAQWLIDEETDFLKITKLFEGEGAEAWQKLVKMINSNDATAYVNHSVSEDTLRWLVTNNWMEQKAGKYHPTTKFRDALNPRSHTTVRREWRGTLEDFNEMMWNKYKDEYEDFPRHFWERNPAKTAATRGIESMRRRLGARFHLGFIDNLWNFKDANGNYIYRAPLPGEDLPEGYVRYSEAMGDSFRHFNEQGQVRLSEVMVPKEFADMIKEQALLISDRQQLAGFMNYFERVTNGWKANTLAAWPAFHGGNMISNYYLNWIGGMQDASKYSLAAKIQRGADGIVYSPWTGQEYKFSELRQLMAAHNVTNGYFRSNMGDEIDRVRIIGENPGTNSLTETMHYIADEMRAINGSYDGSIGGVGKAITGWSIRPRDLIRTDYLLEKALVPLGGQHAWLNKIGFGVGSFIEENARAANFLDSLLNKGMTAERAGANVERVLFNYRKDTRGKRIASTLAPFYEFPVQNTILHLQLFATQPARLSAPFRITGREQAQIDMQDVPEWKRNRLLVDIGDKTYDLSRYFPLTDFTEMKDLQAQGLEHVNPFGQLLVEMGFNYDSFRDRRIAATLEEGDTTVPYAVPLLGLNVNVNPKALFFFRSTYRAFSEFERFSDDPTWQTALGLREVDYDRQTNIRYDLVNAREALSDAKHELVIRRMPREGRPSYSPEQIHAAEMQVAQETMRTLSLLADQYVTGKAPFTDVNIPMWTGDGTLSKDGILSEMHLLLAGSKKHPEYGLWELARRNGNDELEGWVQGAIEENLQQRALLRMVLAADEWGPYADGDVIERGSEGYEAYKESRQKATSHYDTALGYVEDVIRLHGTDDVWKVAHFELYARMLRERTDTLGYSHSNFESNFDGLTSRNLEVYRLWTSWEGISQLDEQSNLAPLGRYDE